MELPAPTPRLRFRAMTEADLPDVTALETTGSRGPSGWIEWTLRNYREYGAGLRRGPLRYLSLTIIRR